MATSCTHTHKAVPSDGDPEICLEKGCPNNTISTCSTDNCAICYSELKDLENDSDQIIQLKCGHIFHENCVNRQLTAGYPTKSISVNYLKCVVCREMIEHSNIEFYEYEEFFNRVKQLCLLKLAVEAMDKDPEVMPGGRHEKNPMDYALEQFNLYKCSSCTQPYYGGLKECGQAEPADDTEFKCEVCRNESCPHHGSDYVTYKCRYCCNLSVWFCFGTTHFCNECHDIWDELERKAYHELSQCKGGDSCPLGCSSHAPNGFEHCFGCSLCVTDKHAEAHQAAEQACKEVMHMFYDDSFDVDMEWQERMLSDFYMKDDFEQQAAARERERLAEQQRQEEYRRYREDAYNYLNNLFHLPPEPKANHKNDVLMNDDDGFSAYLHILMADEAVDREGNDAGFGLDNLFAEEQAQQSNDNNENKDPIRCIAALFDNIDREEEENQVFSQFAALFEDQANVVEEESVQADNTTAVNLAPISDSIDQSILPAQDNFVALNSKPSSFLRPVNLGVTLSMAFSLISCFLFYSLTSSAVLY